jgi:hypothetical protein
MEENKQEYVDTQERIDTFQDEAWEKLSVRANNLLKVFECDTPSDLKKIIESNFSTKRLRPGMYGPKTKAELVAFFEEFERNHPVEAYHVLSERETVEYNLRRNATFLHQEDIDFVLSYFDRTNHYPMFYMLAKYFEHTDRRKVQMVRDYLGICGERKTIEQLMDIVDSLPTDERMLLTLYYLEDRPLTEIAYITNIDAKALANRLFRTRKKLYKKLSPTVS